MNPVTLLRDPMDVAQSSEEESTTVTDDGILAVGWPYMALWARLTIHHSPLL